MADVNLWPVWKKLKLSELQRSKHVQGCLLCKAAIDQCALTVDPDFMAEVANFLKSHTKTKPLPGVPSCKYADCIHHEDVSRELGLSVLKLHGDEKPWRDNRGVFVGLAPICATKDDKPAGFEIGKDIRHKKQGEEPVAAEVYVRLGKKKATIHLWMTPACSSRHEDEMEAVGLWELKRIYEEDFSNYQTWVMEKWKEMKGLAELELSAGKPAVEPKRKTRKKK